MRKCWHIGPEYPCERRKTEIAHGDGEQIEKVNLCRHKDGEVCPYDLSHDNTVEGMRNALKEAQNSAKLRKYAKGRME